MIGETVVHPQYGQGTITAQYRNGNEWMVRFESGLRFRRPRVEFAGQENVDTSTNGHPLGHRSVQNEIPDFTPMTQSQFDARQIIEALRVGVAPAKHVQELTIGLENERTRLNIGLTQAHSDGGSAFAIIGDYGHGKSHIVELTAQQALEQNFLVSMVSLDLGELPPHRSFDIYAGLMRNLRYPDTDERGIGPLLEKSLGRANLLDQFRNTTTVDADPLAFGLAAINNTSSIRQQKVWHQWFEGGRRVKTMNRSKPRGVKFPSIYRMGHNERQMAYLLSGVSVMARLLGYSGLCVLIDEAESYSLLMKYQQPKASLFFSAVIYAAMQEQQSKLRSEDFPQHRYRDYPLSYDEKQSLFFLFTVTRSENQLPLTEWLAGDQILELEPHHSAQELGQFLEKVMLYHAQAYSYEIGERQRQIRRGAAEHLALGMKNFTLSIRGTVRLGVELFDLLYLYPDYEVTTLLDELRSTLRM
ncbi:MAG: BREX system ATP-binding domain-containing protein [Chloroflexota bacterium]